MSIKIRYIGREEVMRFGRGIFTVEDARGAQLVRAGRAKAEVDPASPPVSKLVKNSEKPIGEMAQKKKGSNWAIGSPTVAWIHDTEKLGGAELSNQTVIKVGKKLGFGIYECYPATFDKKQLARCDLFIINNFFFFKPEQYHYILDLLFEYRRPYVKYEHDHREIIGEQARPKLARLLFERSFLNIFISPFQADNHRKHLGGLIDPYFLLPPAVDTSLFKLMPEVKRDEKKMVNVCGKLYESKGFRHMLAFCMANQKKHTFEIYTKNDQEVRAVFRDLENVEVFSLLPNKALPKIYNSAGYTIHLPHALEACGRTIAEGLLCGCKPILNKNVGITSFKHFRVGDKERFNLDKFRDKIEKGVYDFWRQVELYYHGIKPLKEDNEKKEDYDGDEEILQSVLVPGQGQE